MRQQSDIRLHAGVLITKTFTLIAVLACVDVNFVCGLQSSVLADLKQVERASPSRISNKVKRAQEVVMFGNQQNKLSDHNYVRADKREISDLPVPDIQNTQDKDEIEEPIAMASIDPLPSYPLLSAIRDRYYNRNDEPDMYDTAFYEDRQKRNILKKSPTKRSDRIFRSVDDENNRAKRESQLNQMDPEELLSLLATWEEEQQQHRKIPPSWRNIGRNTANIEYEPYSSEYFNEADSDDNQENDDWLDGPAPMHRFEVKPRFYPPYNTNLISNRQARKLRNLPENDYGHYQQHGLSQRRFAL